MTLEEIEKVVDQTLLILEEEYDIVELEDLGSPTTHEIAERIYSEQ